MDGKLKNYTTDAKRRASYTDADRFIERVIELARKRDTQRKDPSE